MPTMDGLTMFQKIRGRAAAPERAATPEPPQPQSQSQPQPPVRPRPAPQRLRAGNLVLDLGEHVAYVMGRRLDLPFVEFKLLAHLATHQGEPQSMGRLLMAGWGTGDVPGGRDMVKSAVYRLRSRLSQADLNTTYIRTLRGVGYVMPVQPGYLYRD
ncbi:winged helix-turn-helix domain-containing protein [Nonomuraea sp. NPDC050790]|uniref:winged helix-turn-helix domain-containing protein n=1 Tax=Nonomuraea sp. NPDC050790 TaxID=3364371 RepID=UPI0037A7E972